MSPDIRRRFFLLPRGGRVALFERGVFVTRISLDRHQRERKIHHLPVPRDVVPGGKLGMEGFKQFPNRVLTGGAFS